MLGLNPVHWYIAIGILVTSTTIGGIILVEPPLLDPALRRVLARRLFTVLYCVVQPSSTSNGMAHDIQVMFTVM